VLNHSQHNFRQRTTQADLDEIEDWTDRAARRMYEGAGFGPTDVDVFNPYDGYAPMAQFFLEAFQWHGVKRGDAFAFYAGDIRVEGPHPLCSSGGNLGNGRTRTAMYTDSIEQLRGTAGARQVRVRTETALAAFTTPSNGGWIMFGKDSADRLRHWRSPARGDHSQPRAVLCEIIVPGAIHYEYQGYARNDKHQGNPHTD
jgi:hypothetical protein